MTILKMSPDRFREYLSMGFHKSDKWIRSLFGIPNDRYYTVSTWPESLAGEVRVERHRDPPVMKISKSDQT